MTEYVRLAKDTIENYIKNKEVINIPDYVTDALLKRRAGVFVSIHKKDGSLRGCIGTFLPTQDNVALEIIHNAISAATRDPRFPPIQESELEDLVINVDVLGEPEEVSDLSELDPKKYGIIVEKGFRRGLLLPDLEGVDDVQTQLLIAKQKAGIMPGEEVKIYRFTVERYY